MLAILLTLDLTPTGVLDRATFDLVLTLSLVLTLEIKLTLT